MAAAKNPKPKKKKKAKPKPKPTDMVYLGVDMTARSLVRSPVYELLVYPNGNRTKRLSGAAVDLRSVTRIQTAKRIGDAAGTWQIAFKDKRAASAFHDMDVVRIRLGGNGVPVTVLIGVVDEVHTSSAATPNAATEDVQVSGRCLAKYLQVTNMFLPVWNPEALLPTALTFGLGDPLNRGPTTKTGRGTTPLAIFNYVLSRYGFGKAGMPGVSGIPSAKYWVDGKTRFSRAAGFQVPFVQFDEDSLASALARFAIPGFTETWVDEFGRVVFRRPGWNKAPRFTVATNTLKQHAFTRADAEMATYVEVIPAGMPGLGVEYAQAIMAGRAPVPSSYLGADKANELATNTSREFVIQTDSNGRVTAKGRKNVWYQRQRRYGLRPQQVVSPMLFSQEQAQAQAEGLLRLAGRMQKTAQITIPGDARVRLGEVVRVVGPIDGRSIDRTYYIEGVIHEYEEGSHFDTTLELTYGRDPGDPAWPSMTMPALKGDWMTSSGGSDGGSGGTGGDTGGVVLPPGSVGGTDPGYGANGEISPSGRATSRLRGPVLSSAYHNSPIPGQRPQTGRTHDTSGLDGYPAYDYFAPPGTPVVAPASGLVFKLSGKDPKLGGPAHGPLGWSIYIAASDGSGTRYYMTHIDKRRVKLGMHVTQGQVIAYVAKGTPGWQAEPHCHMGMMRGARGASVETASDPVANAAILPDRPPVPKRAPGTYRGSPVPGQRPQTGQTHPTDNLPGYPAYDYFGSPGTPVVSPVDGRIRRQSGKSPKEGGLPGKAMGWSLYVTSAGGTVDYYLTHIDHIVVKVGQAVRQGQRIAEIAKPPAGWGDSHVHCGRNGNWGG